jgi:tetratricopeptide (TPR) repeat protein
MIRPGSTVLALVLASGVLAAGSDPRAVDRRLDELEAKLGGDPASLRLAAEYRQLVIAIGCYDRSVKLFERLSQDPRGGANRFLNLALAYVDKVPVSGSVRQALLGRDAIQAASRAIAIAPTDIAYFIRGLVNLYYNRAMFHRTDKGVADLEHARALAADHPPTTYAARIFAALGDGYWRLSRPAQARAIWHEGVARYPDAEPLRMRAEASDSRAQAIVDHALDADVRVDTTLRELFPDLAVEARTPVP